MTGAPYGSRTRLFRLKIWGRTNIFMCRSDFNEAFECMEIQTLGCAVRMRFNHNYNFMAQTPADQADVKAEFRYTDFGSGKHWTSEPLMAQPQR
jgi:hypothetical protein